MDNIVRPWDVEQIRQDFPVLQQQVNQHPLAYLDNAATAQKPLSVINTMRDYYLHDNANVHRGIHTLSERASQAYEDARVAVRDFISAGNADEIIFTKGTTEAINLFAQAYGQPHLKAGDEIIITQMEHHANWVPWQTLCNTVGATLHIATLHPNGDLDCDHFESLLSSKTRLIAITHTSNVTGAITPAKQLIAMAHARQIPVLLDGAQSIVHGDIDVQALDCDFFVFSAHKLYGPTGIGVLYAKAEYLARMRPYQYGGNMIQHVSAAKTTYADSPAKFEAGTPHIAGALGLGAAINYLNQLDTAAALAHETKLLQYAQQKLTAIEGLNLLAQPSQQAPVISFVMPQIHAHDLAHILDQYGVAVRTGHHCAMPLMAHLGVTSTLRASFAFYNTLTEVDQLVDALEHAKQFFL